MHSIGAAKVPKYLDTYSCGLCAGFRLLLSCWYNSYPHSPSHLTVCIPDHGSGRTQWAGPVYDVLFVLLLSFLALLLANIGCLTFLLLMNNQPCPRFFFVPFEARKDREFHFVVGLVGRDHQRRVSSIVPTKGAGCWHTFFLNCLWMASSASLIVTPFRFRAVTSRPNGK